MEIIMIAITACLINNVVLSQFLGICAFLGVSQKSDSASGMGMAVTFVLTLSSLVCGVIYKFLLVPFNVEYLKTIAFILIVAALVQFVEMFTKKFVPSLYEALGIYLPLITTNCAVLGVALLNVQNDYDILTGTIHGFATAIGFWLAIVILAFIREKMVFNDVPKPFRGFPIVMITSALMSIAFFGFAALK
ncbi:MAG: RnfABCDGE type electron transport complex subunit A [Lachnospiraceae bacterium]|jgi:electron transport complex protein RnfA|nr:RnfABCDGE type electron transport complex subunit A [Lachnospiraceae bacterium]